MLEQLEQKPVDAALEIIQRQQQAVTAATESITNTGNSPDHESMLKIYWELRLLGLERSDEQKNIFDTIQMQMQSIFGPQAIEIANLWNSQEAQTKRTAAAVEIPSAVVG